MATYPVDRLVTITLIEGMARVYAAAYAISREECTPTIAKVEAQSAAEDFQGFVESNIFESESYKLK
jgi:hypothetical protein